MKEKLLHFGSYVLVAMLSTVLTLTMVHLDVGLRPSKLDQLEALIDERFIGEADMLAYDERYRIPDPSGPQLLRRLRSAGIRL